MELPPQMVWALVVREEQVVRAALAVQAMLAARVVQVALAVQAFLVARAVQVVRVAPVVRAVILACRDHPVCRAAQALRQW
jgi:hypothetical protein